MGYIGRGPVKSGAFRIIDDISSSFNGSTTGFTVQHNSSNLTPGTEQNLLIAVDGVMQEPVDAFTISGSTITFTSAPASGASFWGVELGDVGGIASSLANGTVDTAQLADDAVTAAKLANSINTEITANTAKVTNATHTGDVTGATALTIATDAVDIAMLSATGTASSSTFLRGDNSWAAAGGAVTRHGGTTSEATTTSTSAVDVLTVSSLTIAATSPLEYWVDCRKTTGASVACGAGLKLNNTVAGEAVTSESRTWRSGANNAASQGGAIGFYGSRVSPYVASGYGLSTASQTQLTEISKPYNSNHADTNTISTFGIRGISGNGSVTMAADELHIYSKTTS